MPPNTTAPRCPETMATWGLLVKAGKVTCGAQTWTTSPRPACGPHQGGKRSARGGRDARVGDPNPLFSLHPAPRRGKRKGWFPIKPGSREWLPMSPRRVGHPPILCQIWVGVPHPAGAGLPATPGEACGLLPKYQKMGGGLPFSAG